MDHVLFDRRISVAAATACCAIVWLLSKESAMPRTIRTGAANLTTTANLHTNHRKDDLLSLSYLTPNYFPYHRVPLVMETSSGQCDLFWDGVAGENPCRAFSERQSYEPDPHNREVIATALHHCQWDPGCQSLDIGSNIGYMAAMMVMMKSKVIAIEPQLELVDAFQRTIELNGWQNQVKMFGGFATMSGKVGNALCDDGWRFHSPNRLYMAWLAPFIDLRKLILGLDRKVVDLVKIDTDTVDGEILSGLLNLEKSHEASITSIVTEFSGGTAQMLFDFQQLGYTIYRLNVHMLQRTFDSKGHDIINNFAPVKLAAGFEERYFVRYIKYALVIKKGLTVAEIEPLITNPVCPGACTQFFITKLELEEPAFENPGDKELRSRPKT